jgi:hypothetical protein
MYGTQSQLGLLLCLLGVWPGFFHVGREIRMGIGKEEEGRDEVLARVSGGLRLYQFM